MIIVAAIFAVYQYSLLESELLQISDYAIENLSTYSEKGEEEYFQACVHYVDSYAKGNGILVQFIDPQMQVISSSIDGVSDEKNIGKDVVNAIEARKTEKYIEKSRLFDERMIAVSVPIYNQNGELIGVIRHSIPTEKADSIILKVGVMLLLVWLVVLIVVLVISFYYIRTIFVPLADIIDKAKMITNGSYGIQIPQKYDAEIGELVETINEMSNQINRNEKIQTEFISSLSHELRTPLTAITGWSETLLSSEDLTEDTRRGMKIIHKEAGRLTEMVLGLLEFTRIQDGRMTLHMETVDLRAEFEDTIFMYGSRLARDGMELEYLENDVEIPDISCDPQRLRQVFLNILDNAAKHSADGKRIEAAIIQEDQVVKITIRDFGPGIPEDELPLVKKKFYKGSSKARGSGIGLAVCDEIVNLHGGTLSLSNADGGGTLVTVELPILQ